jgi:hypothetical protein
MKMKFSLPLAATLLLAGTPLFAQMTGTSHPEDMDDTRQLAPDASDSHYVAPSHSTAVATVTVTAPAPSTPVLIERHPAIQMASSSGLGAVGDPDGQIVTEVPVGPNELPIGARLKGTLQQPISTQSTLAGLLRRCRQMSVGTALYFCPPAASSMGASPASTADVALVGRLRFGFSRSRSACPMAPRTRCVRK